MFSKKSVIFFKNQTFFSRKASVWQKNHTNTVTKSVIFQKNHIFTLSRSTSDVHFRGILSVGARFFIKIIQCLSNSGLFVSDPVPELYIDSYIPAVTEDLHDVSLYRLSVHNHGGHPFFHMTGV